MSWNFVYVFVDCSSGVHPAWFTVNIRKFADLFQAENVDFVKYFTHVVGCGLFVLSFYLFFGGGWGVGGGAGGFLFGGGGDGVEDNNVF